MSLARFLLVAWRRRDLHLSLRGTRGLPSLGPLLRSDGYQHPLNRRIDFRRRVQAMSCPRREERRKNSRMADQGCGVSASTSTSSACAGTSVNKRIRRPPATELAAHEQPHGIHTVPAGYTTIGEALRASLAPPNPSVFPASSTGGKKRKQTRDKETRFKPRGPGS